LVALSIAKAEYVAVGACCVQLLWMKQTLSDFDCKFCKIPQLGDNESAIKLAKNPVQHFVRDHEAKGDIALCHVSTERQLANIH
jgi:hypothetical protein